MKTCETCGYFDPGLQVCELKSKGKWHCVLAADKACDDWTMGYEALLGKVSESLKKAREKHPDFVPLPPFHWGNQLLYEARQYKWKVQDGKGELQEVLLSECYEFMSALAVGDFRHALEEAGDVIAVLYRALNGECKEVRHE